MDWKVTSGHYDARVIRSCQPGVQESTDPQGNGFWSEPSGWAGATVVDMQKGWGMLIDDSYVNGNFAEYEKDPFAGTLGAAYSERPRTCIDKFARVRTRYNDGHVESCDSLPRQWNG